MERKGISYTRRQLVKDINVTSVLNVSLFFSDAIEEGYSN